MILLKKVTQALVYSNHVKGYFVAAISPGLPITGQNLLVKPGLVWTAQMLQHHSGVGGIGVESAGLRVRSLDTRRGCRQI